MLKKIFFSNVSPMIKQGAKRPLELKDIPELPKLWAPHSYLEGFDNLSGQGGGKKFLFEQLRVLKPQAIKLLILISFILIFKMVAPVLIHRLIETIGLVAKGEVEVATGLLTALGLCGVQLVSAILGQHYVYHSVTSTQSAANGINQRISQSILNSKSLDSNKGQILNRTSADAEMAGASLWALGEILQIVLTMGAVAFLLFKYIGFTAVAPIVIMAFLLPLSRFFSGKFSKVQGEIMSLRDERLGRMSQFLDGIRVIKSFVWEKHVHNEIEDQRSKEEATWLKLAKFKTLSSGSYLFASLMVTLVAFSSYLFQGKVLDVATAFTCLMLFSYLEPCFRQLPKVLGDFSSSFIAGERVASILVFQAPKKFSLEGDRKAPSIKVENITVNYPQKEKVLDQVSLDIQSGENVAVVGVVGSGKSSLIKLILDEIPSFEGQINIDGHPRVAYVPQDPFLFHDSLEMNITMGASIVDEIVLKKALYASCLEHDLELLPAGLETEIIEGGGNLSGGQKQRVNLARAAMHVPQLVILDDPFSALDPKTEGEVFERLILGSWSTCTRIVTTHRLGHLKQFDRIVFLRDGKIVANGSFEELLASNHEFKNFYLENSKEESKGTSPAKAADAPQKSESSSNHQVVEVEDQERGEVSLKLYWSYIRAMAGFSKKNLPKTIGLLLLSSLSAMMLPILQNSWLSKWTQSLSSNSDMNVYYLGVYALIGLFTISVCAFQHFYWSKKAIHAAKSLHGKALDGVLGAHVRYFDANPSGRILNRFSRDLDAVEKDLSWSLEEAFMAFLNSIGAVFVLLTAIPLMITVVLPVIAVYFFLQKNYRVCMREAKRLMSVARSPRISSIKEMLNGAPVIRCYGAEEFFQARFTRALSDYQRGFYGVVLINRWFSIRIPLVSSMLSLAAATGIIFLGKSGNISEGLAGMTLIYAFRFWDSLNWTVRAFGEAEAQMTSVERLDSLSEIKKEDVNAGELVDIELKGDITFNNVFASYAPHLPNVLKGSSFEVPAGAKVGVVGRTGAGKSTLFGILHRFIEVNDGEVVIGGEDIKNVPLRNLRSSIGTIPQNPILFSGTIRSNIDPMGDFSDLEIREVLLRIGINLDPKTVVSEGGGNFSRGERQLLCLARALIRKTPIIIVDEATASMDNKTDALIRDILMNGCPGVTVLIIAHKLQSVSQCDMLIEMRDGKVLDIEYRSKTEKAELMSA
ncbi:ABC transporter transmembrane domain-containing protein [Peredibacter starrii]|uniref:ATP-binding cassette domain-containing protein n=1 Tax=Peredibacter starrii TaxID=28202 RepID=A0AAX4HIQ4_9BACT|nr:ABC transporter transmembrane domain-containing protein [Peredibacter starrii]WPU63138.1 ATP-binding cassette domain-containing protein [Peredibacter starrii]